jgi:endogenous inhibitor of DNA gyrase (YacG/DUF329 family)
MMLNPTLTYTTKAFADKCPDCGSEIVKVQFGGPRVGHDDYSGFQFVQYNCGADYYFDDRTEILGIDRTLCPSTLAACNQCGNKVGGLVCTKAQKERLGPFCSDKCAIDWALSHYDKDY